MLRIQEVDEIQFEITKLKNKLKELAALHDKHLNRPTFDDNSDEEQVINAQTQAIMQGLAQCQLKIQKLSIKTKSSRSFSKAADMRLTRSVVSSLASSLQDMTTEFRTNQNAYLRSSHLSPHHALNLNSLVQILCNIDFATVS